MSIALVQAEALGVRFNDDLAKSRFWEKNPTPVATKCLQTFLEHLPGKKVLDLGCGHGQYAPLFIKNGCKYVGIDYSPEMISAARKQNPKARFQIMSLNRLDVEKGLAGVWACHSITNTPKAIFKESLEKIRTLLMPKGVMMTVIPNHGFSHDGMIEYDRTSAWHTAYYPEEIRGLFLHAGFQVTGFWKDQQHETMSLLAVR